MTLISVFILLLLSGTSTTRVVYILIHHPPNKLNLQVAARSDKKLQFIVHRIRLKSLKLYYLIFLKSALLK